MINNILPFPKVLHSTLIKGDITEIVYNDPRYAYVTVQTNGRFGKSNDDEIQHCVFMILNVPLHKVALGVLSQKK